MQVLPSLFIHVIFNLVACVEDMVRLLAAFFPFSSIDEHVSADRVKMTIVDQVTQKKSSLAIIIDVRRGHQGYVVSTSTIERIRACIKSGKRIIRREEMKRRSRPSHENVLRLGWVRDTFVAIS